MTKYLYRKASLYRKARQVITLAAALAVLSFSLQAQFRVPQPERKTPRAVGVLETFKNGSRRLVPVTFFYERRYYDATFYHATPVPFTLYSETVYEVQQFGKPLGTFTVQSATRNSAEWFGNGKFRAAADPALLAKKTPRPVVVEDPSRPVLHRREGSEGDNPSAHPVAAASGAAAEEDPDRPKLHRREVSGENTDASAPATAQTADHASPPAASLPNPTGGAAVAVAKAELTPSDDPDHPVLRRGKPVQEQSGRDLPDFKREEPVLRQVAVSDAGASEPQALIFVCREEERQQMEAQARELAQAELRRLAAQRGLALPSASKSVTAKTPAAMARKHAAATAATPPALALQDERFVPYDLDYNNYATVVFSARYSPEAAGTAAGETGAGAPAAEASAKPKSWVVTLVARQDEGKLVKLYSAVSDPRELDLYPEVRLVDAVDPDGYGRYGLLFREQKRDGTSWLLGRVTGYELETVFETSAR